ncbi:MAG: U32 family peptidase [Kiritimatiellaceae bacterium]|nr:U32 family peptidase [Kiritimatiellaceae bacterium]
MNKQPPELLAPAGTPEAAWAALAYGADAVYAGLPRFSARAEAGNFSAEALDELIGYAHHLGRRVYITFNTLVQQRELDAALETLALIRDLNADGVIVQDMGVVRLAQKNFPELRLHASTQLAVHNLEGAKQLASLGFKRVVLARELSLKEIVHISLHCGIETETFIHGALCYSYSGLCLFSSHLLGRSGNRGRCAYCCRQPFRDGDGKETLPFSMKDFSAAEHLPELLNAGVASLKIEGRMKSPLYVAAVTDFYRKALAGDSADSAQRLADIQTIFGRPSTELYLKNSETSPVDPVNDGHRGALIGTVKAVAGPWLILHSNRALQKHDGLKFENAFGFAADEMRLASDPESKRRFELPADAEIALKLPADAPRLEKGAPVYCSYSQVVRQRYEFTAPRPGQFRQRKPVNIYVSQSSENVKFVASADGVQSELVLPGPFEAAKNPEKAAATIRQCFEKLGDTDCKLGELTLEGAPVFIPVSVLNDARRRLISDFSNLWENNCRAGSVIPPVSEVTDLGYKQEPVAWAVKSRVFQPLENIDEFVLEIDPARTEEIEKALSFYGDKLRLALPVIIREEDVAAFRKLIAALPDQQKWEAANVGGLNLLRRVGSPGLQKIGVGPLTSAGDIEYDITTDWPLYTLNTQAALQWREQGVQQFVLSPEDDAKNLFALIEQLGGAAVVPVYQHTPLMISATRPAASGDELTDRSRRNFRVEPNGRQFVFLNETPFSLTGHLDELKAKGARRFRIDLSYGISSSDEVADIVRRITSCSAVPGHAGNFARGLQ